MASKLPFKVAPKTETVEIGNTRVGVIELPKLGDITVREQSWINDQMTGNSTFLEIARIANKIAKAQKIDPVAAHRFVTTTVANQLGQTTMIKEEKSYENWKIKFAREIEELCAFLLKHQWDRQVVTAAALIRYRVEGMEDFTADDARELSQQLIQELYGFALQEQSPEGADESVDQEKIDAELREELGK